MVNGLGQRHRLYEGRPAPSSFGLLPLPCSLTHDGPTVAWPRRPPPLPLHAPTGLAERAPDLEPVAADGRINNQEKEVGVEKKQRSGGGGEQAAARLLGRRPW